MVEQGLVRCIYRRADKLSGRGDKSRSTMFQAERETLDAEAQICAVRRFSLLYFRLKSMRRYLNSWKEIAAYVGRGVRTLQRYESQYGFPVRRVAETPRAGVFAFSDEIDEWFRQTRRSGLDLLSAEGTPLPPSGASSSALTDSSSTKEDSDPSIFVIEDDVTRVDEIRSILSQMGESRVRVFLDSSTAAAALNEVIEGNSPAPKLLVLDYELRNGNGFDILVQYRSCTLKHLCPLIVWTVLDNVTTRQMSIWMGAAAFVPKQLGSGALRHALLPLLAQPA